MTTEETAGDPSGDDRFLILMRHAKSDWSDESLSDHDRPLNGRGRRDAPRMAHWLADVDLIPDVILSSSSLRTRETVGLMTEAWSTEPEIFFNESLYLAAPGSILGCAQSDASDARRLMIVAHNPGMAHLVSSLSGQIVEMPTAAIAVFQFASIDWKDLQPPSSMSHGTSVKLVHYMRPKAL